MSGLARLEMLARIGFASRGILYLLIGYAALVTGRSRSGSEVMADLGPSGPGRLLLFLMALGFLGYGLWRLIEAAFDTEGNGDNAKGWAKHCGGAVSGLIHLGLSFTAIKLATRSGSGSTDSARSAATETLALPGGQALLIIVALVLVLVGLFQVREAISMSFLKFMDAQACRQAWVRWAGRVGYVSRGIVFGVLGWLLVRAAMNHDTSQVGEVGAAIGAVPEGIRWLLATGLTLFGLFSFVQSRYRQINDSRVVERLLSIAPR